MFHYSSPPLQRDRAADNQEKRNQEQDTSESSPDTISIAIPHFSALHQFQRHALVFFARFQAFPLLFRNSRESAMCAEGVNVSLRRGAVSVPHFHESAACYQFADFCIIRL